MKGELFNHMGEIEEANLIHADDQLNSWSSYPMCNTPWDLLSINCDGQAVGCNYDFDNRFVIGSLHEESFLELWNSARMQFFRQSILDHTYNEIEGNGSMCSACSIKWQKDYHLPTCFSTEIKRMESYLGRAIHRCANHVERNLEFREMETILFKHKADILNTVSNGDILSPFNDAS